MKGMKAEKNEDGAMVMQKVVKDIAVESFYTLQKLDKYWENQNAFFTLQHELNHFKMNPDFDLYDQNVLVIFDTVIKVVQLPS